MVANLKVLSGLLLVVALIVMVTGSIGYTSVEADREITIEVVDDEDAYVGFLPDGSNTTSDGDLILAEVRNQLPSDTELTITDWEVTTDDGNSIDAVAVNESIAPGEATHLTVEACAGEDLEVSVSVDASGNGVEIQLASESRTFEVSCTS